MEHFTPEKAKKFFVPGTVILIIAGILAVIFLGTSFYIVDQTEEAVVTRFGKYHAIRDPGLQFKLPFGIDKQYIVNVKSVQTEQFGFRTLKSGSTSSYANQENESNMLTGDLNIVEVEWIIQYRIMNSMEWIFKVAERTSTIRDVSRSVINQLVGDRAIMDIMGPQRSAIETAAVELMNNTFRDYELGINVIAVQLQNIDPPQGVQAAFDDVNKAIQDMNRFINEGQQVYNEEIPRTRGEVDKIIQIARGEATERVNRAKGDVARFNSVYEEYRRAPELTRQRLYYEMIEEVFKDDKNTIIIDRNFNNFLPMRNLGGVIGSGAAAEGAR
ncbi:HflK protein [Spirochaetia bacterium]|nr:HflK protein [Spirochaetia bacterium]